MKEEELSKEERVELLMILQNVSNLRTGQDQVVWRIFGAFWSIIALLLISLFSGGNTKWDIKTVGIIISSVGFCISLMWALIQMRAISRTEMVEDSMSYIETKLKLDKELCIYSIPPKEKGLNKLLKLKARTIMRCSSWIVTFLWFLSIIYFLFFRSWSCWL